MVSKKIFAYFLVLLIVCAVVNARPQMIDLDERDADPGWVRRQLSRLGNAAGSVGNRFGGYALKLTNAIDKVCAIIKKIIPIVGAVCTVGRFEFCAIDNVTEGIDVGGSPIAGPGLADGGSPIAGPGIVDLSVQD